MTGPKKSNYEPVVQNKAPIELRVWRVSTWAPLIRYSPGASV